MKLFTNQTTCLKICGVRSESDARELIRIGVDALGVNFWPKSKRYLDPSEALWLKGLAGEILRVGVFVNEHEGLAFRLFEEGMIDAVQLHGDEEPEVVMEYKKAGIPVIKALGVKNEDDIVRAAGYESDAVLLDAYAPHVFGGTGDTFDWSLANEFKLRNPNTPMILAGGIVPENAVAAIAQAKPDAIDVASGAEISPGVKDFEKVRLLLSACRERL